eukprot:TRINITY_DN6460_c0_g2_i1.p1 TRINITY_DN6460_c0_g2~~TRINITY_DN6460_c0_g2_i1.p1  ORF type:complete len:220 (+),score=71.19 TRINITY_DN6460_c0_g2_i1:1-660(+)
MTSAPVFSASSIASAAVTTTAAQPTVRIKAEPVFPSLSTASIATTSAHEAQPLGTTIKSELTQPPLRAITAEAPVERTDETVIFVPHHDAEMPFLLLPDAERDTVREEKKRLKREKHLKKRAVKRQKQKEAQRRKQKEQRKQKRLELETKACDTAMQDVNTALNAVQMVVAPEMIQQRQQNPQQLVQVSERLERALDRAAELFQKVRASTAPAAEQPQT